MGQKKRASAARHFTPAAPPSAPGLLDNSGSPPPIDAEQCLAASGSAFNAGGYVTNGGPVLNGGGGLESTKGRGEELSNAKGDCEKALVALRRGNSSKALKLARDACNRHESNALVQRIRGHICMRLASVIEDATTKERHFKEAIDAARKAVLLSPLSIEYAQFHAQLLFEAATDSKGFEEVEQECQRALSIQNPIDPAKESLYEEGQHKLPTPEARIAQVQQELRGLVQKANITSISNWMKTLGTGASEERLRFIHMRKLVEEPMEQRILQAKRPHEVKKSVKTPEEIRKDIEVRVAAARLLQQKRECSSPQSDDGANAHAKGGTRLERRKSSGVNSRKLNQAQVVGERIDRIKAYWNAIKPKEREGMLEVPIDALKNHFGSSKVSSTAASLTEALEFAQTNKTWRFWVCCNCGDKFVDSQEHAQHTMDKHIDSLPQKLRRLLPSEIDQDMTEQIMDEDCRPFDGPSAIKFLIKSSQGDNEEDTVREQVCSGVSITNIDLNDRANTAESSVENSDIPTKGNGAITANNTVSKEGVFNPGLAQEKELHLDLNNAHVCDGKCQRLKTVQRFVRDMPSYELPYADDVERTKLLQKIYSLFRILIRNKCLASDHMEKIVQYAVDELQSLVPDTSVQYEFNHSPLYVRFLPASQLHRVLRYLRELVTACGLDHLSDSRVPSIVPNEDDDVIPDRLFLNEDFTTLSLDERLLKDTLAKPVEISGRTISDHSVKQDGPSNEADTLNSQPLPLMTVKDGESIAHTDLQLVWIYGTADYEYQTGSWKQFRESRGQQSRDLLAALEKEFLTLQSLCERKREHLHHEMAVNMAEALCIEELKKREMKVDGTLRSFEAVLKRRQQELLEVRSNDLTSQQKLELEVITTIIREAQNVTVPQFSYDSAISVTSSRLCDLDEEDEDAWRVQEFVPQTDSCIEMVIQRQKERCSSEVNKLDARILRVMDNVQRLEQKLGNASVLDYRATVLPLVKAFIKARLEDAAEKDALQKSDAAREAFLAELSRDGKSSVERVPDSVKQTKEKAKDKRKNKENRRVKDGKRLTDIQQRNAIDGTPADELSESFVDDEDGLEWDEDEDLRQEEEAEMRRQAVLEAEERKLAETLELQRRVEEEAKEKHLANLRRKQTESEAHMLNPHADSNLDFDGASRCSSSSVPILLAQTLSECASDILCGSADMSPCESVGSTPFCDSVESVSLFSSQNLSMPSMDHPKNNLSTKDLKDTVLQGPPLRLGALETTPELEKSLDKPVNTPSFDNNELLSRPKRTSKNRRKRSARTQEDSNNSSSKEEQVTSTAQASGFNKGASADGVTTAGTSFPEDTGKVSYEPGSVQLLSSRTSSKTLRQLKAEQDDEERFQADLEQAMRQSLANVAEPAPEVSSNEGFPVSEPDNSISASEEVGKGLQNANGQYNCFLNVVIQSLWHLRRFREELLSSSSMSHVHVGLPCVVCALRDIFLGLNAPMSSTSKDAVAPTNLRVALSALYSQKDFFQEAQMNDASEVLLVVFDCLHKAFAMATSDGDSDTSNGVGSWECHECRPCIAHSLFGLDIAMQMNCAGCKLESRHLKYTSFFHTINASALRTAKMCNPGSSLDELLRFVDMSHWLACDKDVGGCGKLNHIHYLLREAPHVFITVLGWQNNRESFEDIVATVDALEVDLDVGIVYRGLDEGFKHRLVSVVCYYGQHYHCFAFNHEITRWVMFDDTTVKVIGMWEDVVDTCQRGHLQPQVLFYEALLN